METRANYILIGVFTLLSILASLGFFIWLASVQVNQQYQTYGILFDDVTGLDASGDVSFNGISVGHVIGLEVSQDDPSKVFATIEIEAGTPVRSDTVAQLKSQGVTGVSYVSLAGGTLSAAPLEENADGWMIIPSQRSSLQSLVDDAPDLLDESIKLIEQFSALSGPENQALVTNILSNLSSSSGRLDQALDDFSEISGTVREATAQITTFTGRLDEIGGSVAGALEQTESAMAAATTTFQNADQALDRSVGAIESAQGTFDQATLILQQQVPDILSQLSQAATRANTAIADLQTRGGTTLDGFTDTADLLNARLVELETSLVAANTAFSAVTDASTSFDTLVEGDGALLVSEAREVVADTKAAIATVESVVLNDVPAVMADIRTGVATARDAVETVSANLTQATSRIDPMAAEAEQAIASANALFSKAQTSLVTLDATLDVAKGALGSAQTTFDAASDVLATDIGPMMTDIRTASVQISQSVADVTQDMPQITAELRALIARSDAVVAQVQSTIAQSAPGITDFSSRGLSELTRLAAEARTLVNALGSLSRRIESDPTGFILNNNRVPDYRK
ncbi:MAG: MlaD family protein [Sulfitobacter sp.]